VIDSGVIAQPFRPQIALVMKKLAAGVRLFLRQTAIGAVLDSGQRAKKSENLISLLRRTSS
jgi:hypothetical protein